MFYDLNLQNESLIPQAESLGWKACKASIVRLENDRDFRKINPNEMTAVESTDSELLRRAAKTAKSALLINPLLTGDFHRDDGLIRIVAEKNCIFEIPIYSFLNSSFVMRAKLFSETASFLKKCTKLKVPFIFTSRAQSAYDLKTPREIIALGQTLGLSYEQASWAIEETPKKAASF